MATKKDEEPRRYNFAPPKAKDILSDRRLEELAIDIGDTCPNCGSAKVTDKIDLKLPGLSKVGPMWLQCTECNHLFMARHED